ncbi:MAG: PIG-L family deacetylase [Clostridia bacterium]|nr:PIG-L family deacetylase [Clostridia bacterium]
MEQYRFLMIGAHPDDMELRCGGLAMRLRRKGHQVMFLSMTDGSAGHHRMTGDALRERRRAEAQAAAAALDVAYRIMPVADGRLEANLKTRELLIREIRTYAPHVILTHRSADYHPDHRACGQLVMDCAYLLNVPLICPDTPCPNLTPVILSAWDRFKKPLPFAPDVAVPIDDLVEKKIDAALCHVSQFYEWLPYVEGWADVESAATFEEKTALLRAQLRARFAGEALLYPALVPDGVCFAETFEWNEYGAPLTDELRRAMTDIPAEK